MEGVGVVGGESVSRAVYRKILLYFLRNDFGSIFTLLIIDYMYQTKQQQKRKKGGKRKEKKV